MSQGKYTYLDKTETILFENKQEVQDAFDNKFILEKEVELDINQSTFIKGYSVDYPIRLRSDHPDYMDEIHCLLKQKTVMFTMRQDGMLLILRKAGNMVTVLNLIHL